MNSQSDRCYFVFAELSVSQSESWMLFPVTRSPKFMGLIMIDYVPRFYTFFFLQHSTLDIAY